MSAESIGERLKKVRQEKGLSLEEAQKKTKIHLNILKAIEGDSLTNLSPIYLKGFLKIYCRFLGLDPKECIPDYKEPQSSLAQSAPTVSRKAKPDETLKAPQFLESVTLKLSALGENKRLIKVILLILAVFIAFVILVRIGKYISSRPKISPAVRHLRETKALAKPKPVTQRVAPALAKPQTSEATLFKEATSGISLVIAAKENCLVFVKVDGHVVLHRVLEKGRTDSWKAKDRIELSLGNAAAVELIINGQRFSNLGRRGQQLKNIVITEKEGLRIPR